MNPSPALTQLAAAIMSIPPQAWTEPANEPASATKEVAACLPMPEVETTQPAPPEPEEAGEDDASTTVLEKARLIRTIGSRLAEARKLAGWTQRDAAELLGYNLHRLRKLESAENVVTVAFWLPRRAAEIYGCTVDFIFGLSNDPEMTSLEHAYEFGVSKWMFRVRIPDQPGH